MTGEVTGHLDETPIDYFDDVNTQIEVAENTIERLTHLADLAKIQEVKIAALSKDLAEEQEELVKIVRVLMPNIMEELGMAEFKMVDGRVISINPKVNASIQAEQKPLAYEWLEQNGYDGIIKTKVGSEFGKGEMEFAVKAQKALQEAGFMATLDRNIHPATLLSFVKERLAAGDTLPRSFSVFEFKEAKIKEPKAKKK